MPTLEQRTTYGNLHAYRLYTRPTAKRLFGNYSFRKKSVPKHHENVQRMLHILAIYGALTTWGMAKSHLANDIAGIRVKEKEYRRLLVGRKERGKRTLGVLDVGLVVKDGKSNLRGESDLYRLSLHGILYCLDVLDLSQKEIDTMALKYSHVLPWVFGRWDYLKSYIGDKVYQIRILASGMFLDNVQITKISKFPIYEIMTYISVKYQNNYEQIEEKDLADQISLWFYSHLLIPTKLGSSNTSVDLKKWNKIFSGDNELKKWFFDFLDETIKFYQDRFTTVRYLKTD